MENLIKIQSVVAVLVDAAYGKKWMQKKYGERHLHRNHAIPVFRSEQSYRN